MRVQGLTCSGKEIPGPGGLRSCCNPLSSFSLKSVLASLFSEYARILVQSATFLLTTLLKLLHLAMAALIISSAAVT
jgi:hypothetical protein